MKKYTLTFVLLIFLTLVVQSLLILTKADIRVDNAIEDMVYQSGSAVFNTDIYVIGIDAESMAEFGQYETWSRTKVAELINTLCADEKNKPAVIGLDIGYFYERGEEEDKMLVEAVKNAGNVVLIETYEFKDKNRSVHVRETPFQALSEVARGIGFSNTQMDDDGVMRHAWGSFEYEGVTRNSFAMELYRVFLESRGLQFDETANGYYSAQQENYYLVYAGKGGFYYGSAGAGNSISRVLSGEIPTREFKDAIVLVGAYAESTQDNYFTSNDKTSKMYGVEIHANAVNQLINGDYKHEVTLFWRLVPTLVMGILSALVAIYVTERKASIPVVFGLGVLYVLAAVILAKYFNWLFPIVEPVFIVLVLGITTLVVSLLQIRFEKQQVQREKEWMDKSLKRFLSPAIVRQLRDSEGESAKLSAQKKDVAVLFVDIRNFTTISEGLDPTEIVTFLNEFFKITTKAIFDNEGTVDKFIGDNTMGFFNAPLDIDDYVFRAVKAGLQMSKGAEELDKVLAEHLQGRIGFGVGIHTGEAVVGNIGTEERMEYTAIGDTVNVASRLEGQAKAGEVIVSEEIYKLLNSRSELEFYDERIVKLKGKTQDSKIYKVRWSTR